MNSATAFDHEKMYTYIKGYASGARMVRNRSIIPRRDDSDEMCDTYP